MLQVAIIGGGIAGLSAARHLEGKAEVTLFERSEELGGHARTLHCRGIPIDYGFIVFNRARYPGLSRMFAELGVRSQLAEMSFGVSAADGSFGYSTRTLRSLYADSSSLTELAHHRMVIDLVSFLHRARRDHRRRVACGLTLKEYLDLIGARPRLRDRFVYPLAGALWSAGHGDVLDFPAEVFLGFLYIHGMLRPAFASPWRTVVGGSKTYVDALVDSLARVHFRCAASVRRIRRTPHTVCVELESGEMITADRLIICTHANQAVSMLGSESHPQIDALKHIRYDENRVVVHTDETALPVNRAARAAWNYRVSGSGKVAVTYWCNKLQKISATTHYMVTLNPNPSIPIDPTLILHQTTMSHPQFDLAALSARRTLAQLQGQQYTYFAGAYFGHGFHEDGFRSGFAAAAKLLADHASTSETAVA